MIKALYLRKQDRIEHKKKVTDLDERYFRMAEDYLNSELSLALDISKEKINEYIKETDCGVKATVLFYFIEKTACVSRRQFLYSDDLFDGGSGFASQTFFCLVQRSDDRLTPFLPLRSLQKRKPLAAWKQIQTVPGPYMPLLRQWSYDGSALLYQFRSLR